MRITLNTLYNSWESLNKLGKLDLPASIAFDLSRAIKKTLGDVEDVVKIRADLLEKYGEATEKGSDASESDQENKVQLSDKNNALFVKEFAAVLKKEIDLNIEPIDIDLIAGCKLSALNLYLLDWLIVKPLVPVGK